MIRIVVNVYCLEHQIDSIFDISKEWSETIAIKMNVRFACIWNSKKKHTHTGRENPFHNDSKWLYRKSIWILWIFSHHFIKPSEILRKKKGLWDICLFNIDSRYSDTDKNGWFNKWINSKPTIHPMICYWILNTLFVFEIYIHIFNMLCLALVWWINENRCDISSKRNSAKLCFLFGSFGDQLKDLNVFVSPVQNKKKNTKISHVVIVVSLFRVTLIFEIPVCFFFHPTFASHSRWFLFCIVHFFVLFD